MTPSNRPRGKTIDDEDVYNTLRSPAKILAQNEGRIVPYSRSFTDLTLSASHSATQLASSDNEIQKKGPKRRIRRRSTLPWSGGNPETRQIKLEDVMRGRMADTWFSIHCDGIESPVYISEVVEKAANPSYHFFDLNICGPHVARLDTMTFKLWAKTADMSEYILLVELRLSLRSLQFVGKTLESFHQPLPSNSVLFHFADGIYTNLTDLPPTEVTPSAKAWDKVHSKGDVQSASSYDALMRLANLDDCIQDALATREKLEVQISAILEKKQDDLNTVNEDSRAREKLSLTKRAVAAERRELRGAAKRKEELISSIRARRNSMAEGRQSQDRTRSHLPDAQQTLASRANLLESNVEDSRGQICRICEELLTVYPIEPVPDTPLAFTIAGLELPNSSFEDIDRTSVAAALGYTAHLVYLLSFYLSVPIPYPVQPYLSHSVIQDPISVSLPQRTFPLYPVNVQSRFEYGVFLLNKDIEFLMNRRGLRVLDIRHTLPNLKYLLYVLTAGTSELPSRKAGGVRGLLWGQLATPTQSRRNSEDSITSGEPVQSRKPFEPFFKMNGHGHGHGHVGLDKDRRHHVASPLAAPLVSTASSAQISSA
jgi:UV radiation resistance-associated gene protein